MTRPAAGPVTLRCASCRTPNRVELSRAAEKPKCGECGRPFHLDRPVKVAAEDFDRTVRRAGAPVVVDFYADWCAPCKMLTPILEELAAEAEGRVLVAKIDTDRATEVASEFEIRSIPTVIRFEEGKEVERSMGIEPERLRSMMSLDPSADGSPDDG